MTCNRTTVFTASGATAALAIASLAHADCMGDVNHDGVVDGADLALVLAAWETSDPAADVDGTGIVDGRDIGYLLAHWGPCPPELVGTQYELTLPAVFGIVNTDLGAQPVSCEAYFLATISNPNESGICRVRVDNATILYSSAQTVDSETGGMDMQVAASGLEGSWNLNTGSFSVPLLLDTSSWLINEIIPGEPTNCTEEDSSEGFTASERWEGIAQGVATGTPGEEFISLPFWTLNLWPKTFIMPGVDGAFFVCGQSTPQRRPQPPIDGCPPANRCKLKSVCIQPVFIGSGPNDPNASGSSYEAQKAKADELWTRCCVYLDWKPPKYINKPEYRNLKADQEDELRKEEDPLGSNDCIEVFFVSKMINNEDPPKSHRDGDGNSKYSGRRACKIIVADEAASGCDPPADTVLAHELGHGIGQCQHHAEDPNAINTVMEAHGHGSGACPTPNPSHVKAHQCEKMYWGALVRYAEPEEQCCKNPG